MIVPPPGAPVMFTDVRVFDGADFHDERAVIVANGVIAGLGPASEAPSPGPDVAVIDGRGRTLLPGFVDTHVHIGFHRPGEVLRRGVTTARDLGWQLGPMRGLAYELAISPSEGPMVMFAGAILTAPGGYPSAASWAPRGTAMEVETPDDARAAVAELIEAGACVIKVAQEPRSGPVIEPDVLRAVVDAAHAAGRGVVSHCGSLTQLDLALDAGVDELAHGLWSDERLDDETIARMVDAGVVVAPTLHVDPSPERLDAVGRFAHAHGRVVYGTDMGNPPTPPGIDVEELALMCRAGMTPRQVLAAATGDAADHLGLDDRGWIEVGARADLVLVEGDPAQDFAALAEPLVVMREGIAVG